MGDGPLATEAVALLERAGARTAPADTTDQPAAVVLPLDLPEDELRRRTALVLDRGTPLVTYLSTPTRLLLATLSPAHALPGLPRAADPGQPHLAAGGRTAAGPAAGRGTERGVADHRRRGRRGGPRGAHRPRRPEAPTGPRS
ncbi:hypothetical protein O1L55_28150 [Streptomyces albulus]|nr:hypothetical protein [Streptomyces noursei]